jgi:signal transduction histidine kinase
MNILINAKDALSGNAGQIHVRTDFDQDRVSVEIVDTGCGIPGEDLPRIFDPGFTTKGVGVGTGLGLAICYQIVEQHGGTIEVAPGPDSGTRVSVSLGRTLPDLQ